MSNKELTSRNAQRLAVHKGRMKQAGFQRLNVWVSAELAKKLDGERQLGECYGRILERLVLGEAEKRPKFPYGGDA